MSGCQTIAGGSFGLCQTVKLLQETPWRLCQAVKPLQEALLDFVRLTKCCRRLLEDFVSLSDSSQGARARKRHITVHTLDRNVPSDVRAKRAYLIDLQLFRGGVARFTAAARAAVRSIADVMKCRCIILRQGICHYGLFAEGT